MSTLSQLGSLRCPVCKEGYSTEPEPGDGVSYERHSDGSWSHKLVCQKPECRAEAKRQTDEFFKTFK